MQFTHQLDLFREKKKKKEEEDLALGTGNPNATDVQVTDEIVENHRVCTRVHIQWCFLFFPCLDRRLWVIHIAFNLYAYTFCWVVGMSGFEVTETGRGGVELSRGVDLDLWGSMEIDAPTCGRRSLH